MDVKKEREILQCGIYLTDDEFFEDGLAGNYLNTRIRIIENNGLLYYHKMVNGETAEFKKIGNILSSFNSKNVTPNFYPAIRAFAADFELAKNQDIPLTIDKERIAENYRLREDIERISELEFNMRHGTIKFISLE